jgi:hypothetical protein
MKSLRQIAELKKIDIVPDPELQSGVESDYTKPKSKAERDFVGKHVDVIQHKLHPAYKNEAEQDAVFKGGSINKDHSKAASYEDGMDVEVYEAAVEFVKDNLTEDNLEQFENMLEENPEAAISFAIDIAEELEGLVE